MRVLIVDDHPLLRLGARQIVEGCWPDAVVEEAETLAAAVRALQAARPDVVLLDLRLPDADGIESAARMIRLAHDVPVLILSQNAETTHAARLLQLGAKGYVQKDRAASELLTALQRVLAGGRYLSPELADHLVGRLDGGRPAMHLPHESLTTQEFRVMQQIAAGRTPAQIAQTMHLSPKTVGSYRARIFEKTGWRTNAQMTQYCVQHGLLAVD